MPRVGIMREAVEAGEAGRDEVPPPDAPAPVAAGPVSAGPATITPCRPDEGATTGGRWRPGSPEE